jgi:hypothetical protein
MPVSKSRKKKKPNNKPNNKIINFPGVARCGLCGNTKNLTKTSCCDNWICNDADQYKLFTYERNSCYVNHEKYTVCSYHSHNEHPGRWQDCQECRENWMEMELYVEAATNEHNFEILKNPPKFKPSKCVKCGRVIILAAEGYMMTKEGYICSDCEPIPENFL